MILRSNMKATSFQNGVEYKVVVEGESWEQGAHLKGTSTSSVLHTFLAYGIDKKVKAKSPDAFEVLKRVTSPSWEFILPLDTSISDKSASLYILFGGTDQPSSMGALRLNIIPHLHLREVVEVLTLQYRFILKSSVAGKNGFTDFKLDPPDSKDWVQLDQLVLSLKRESDEVIAKFNFKRKELNATDKGTLSTKKTIRPIDATWKLSEIIHSFNGRLNKDAAAAGIEIVVQEYRTIKTFA
ncbi:MAG: hypothetical protein KA715_07505 [Xanthomonadaceae bacterium]|nr:hypothetical protein [Xanthomonadaceae bacterium]